MIGNNNQLQASSNTNKWIINLSNTPLTQSQESLLSKVPHYATAPKNPPNLDYITATETACQKLNDQGAEELRADINGLLRKLHAPGPNLNKEESKAVAELKSDKDRKILTADKGGVMVDLDKKDYIKKPIIYYHNQLMGLQKETQPINSRLSSSPCSGKLKGNQDWKKTSTNPCMPQVALP